MKTAKYEFQWFEKEDHRRQYRASVSREGKLRLGRTLCRALPSVVQIGFDARHRVLAIADGHGDGTLIPKCGILNAHKLSSIITASGLRLPVAFQFVRDESTGFFLGHILPVRRRNPASNQMEYDTEQLLVLYQHIIDCAVSTMAKSTPLADRKACALEAFHAAVKDYRPGYGDLALYLEEHIRRCLMADNRQYTSAYTHRSLDQPLSGCEDSGFCLYDTVEASTLGGIDCLEERIMAEQFLSSLSAQELQLSQMLSAGCSLSQISAALSLTESQLVALGQEIGAKRRMFYAVA